MIQRDEFQGIPYVIFLPETFLRFKPLPLVVLFRAHPDEWFQARQDPSRGRRTVFLVVQDLIEKEKISPCAFLFPSTQSLDGSEFYFAEDVFSADLRQSQGSFLTQKLFHEELLPSMAEKYPVDISRVSLDGFSLGGFTSLSYAFQSPRRYQSVGSFDGALLDYDFDNRRVSPGTPSDLTFDQFPYLFGDDPQEEFFRARNPMDLVGSVPLSSPLFLMATAEETPTANRPRVEQFAERMQSAGIENHAPQLLIHQESRHNWFWVDQYLTQSLPFHAACLNGVSQAP
jgi:S-formylglutathione hydrolase FrmB